MSVQIRPAEPGDEQSILALAAASLGWSDDDRHAALYRWKHVENAFGPSPTWVAVDGDMVVGLRCFLRWEFLRGGVVVQAVRAVDTATHPDYRGRGVFRDLTMTAVDALRDEGVAFVFNTPNRQSLPGYLGMGWVALGRAPVQVRPASPRSVPRLLRARVPADMWPLPGGGGAVPIDAVSPPAESSRFTTNRTASFLRWRYGSTLLGYQTAASGATTAVYRVRRRGLATEAVVCDVLGAGGLRALGAAARRSGADYALWTGPPAWRAGFVPLPGQGPLVTWRALADTTVPSLSDFDFRLGDLELL